MQAFSETFQTKTFYPKRIRKCITCERSINKASQDHFKTILVLLRKFQLFVKIKVWNDPKTFTGSHNLWLEITGKRIFLNNTRIWGVPSVLQTRYKQAATTCVVFLPLVNRLLTAILKKLNAVSIQCWFNLSWEPTCWIDFLPTKYNYR